MQDFIGSVRRSLVFKSSAGDDGIGGFVGKIESSIRKSRIGLFSKPPLPALPPTRMDKDDARQIRWRKGELIGCGAFGRVYMGMDLDSGELIAVKQVSIAGNFASKEKTQAHIWELEEEVKLLKNLSHQNIVRYLGTAREEECLNIMLEFVPGGSISSLLGKFGSFPEAVIRMYTKQLLLGLEYLHKNGIMHRDIKGANILVDNKGCIKLADFGASKKVVELATMTGAKSMKGTPYWMAPEVIVQTGHSLFHEISPQNQLAMSSADIWSVGCTVIEMATGKPPWSQQYQEVAALFHIGTTKSHPPIPEYLSPEAKDFLLKCLQKEPSSRATASDLLQHLFVTGDYREACHVRSSVMVSSGPQPVTPGVGDDNLTSKRLKDVHNSVRCSTIYPEKFADPIWRSSNPDDDMCQLDDIDDLLVGASTKFNSTLLSADIGKSFNPMSEPNDDWPCKFDESPEFPREIIDKATKSPGASCTGYGEFTFPAGPSAADDDEVTETKIRAFLHEKALDLKKLQTPLYEEFKNSNSLNANTSPVALGTENKENVSTNSCLPPKSKSPKRVPSRRLSAADVFASYKRISSVGTEQAPPDVQPPRASEQREQLLDPLPEQSISSETFSERQRLWEEELYQEIERTREIRRQKGEVKTPSPIRFLSRQKDRSRFGFTGI